MLSLVLHEMGAYGLVRINMKLFSHAHSIFSQRDRFTNNISWIYWRCPFFLAKTSYDKLRLLYLDEMDGMAIPMLKIFTIFTILLMIYLALSGMSDFVAELIVFIGIITSQKYLFIMKILS
ncbi:NAD(P)H-quinone oxidoreductase chain 4 [Medicago truncatula]|uniref:NAD(P)H-quinone oxidoreductase chain 4 n=1 Tax=Medicago truncatula TaxID=3880 RepID=G7KFF2_MEDTR|nr:NAD(P)H-quinone oxidoreductase chain 4 [Medicago truncatula]